MMVHIRTFVCIPVFNPCTVTVVFVSSDNSFVWNICAEINTRTIWICLRRLWNPVVTWCKILKEKVKVLLFLSLLLGNSACYFVLVFSPSLVGSFSGRYQGRHYQLERECFNFYITLRKPKINSKRSLSIHVDYMLWLYR